MIRIDAHHHFWRLADPWHEWPEVGQPALFRDFLPDDFLPELARHGIAGSVLVQAQPNDAETDWMLAVAECVPGLLGVIGWVDLRSPTASERLIALAQRPRLRGIRPMLQALPPEWILDPLAIPALETMVDLGLVLDALVRPAHLEAINELASRFPALAIIVDHAAKPDPAGNMSAWAAGLARLAEHGNVSCKLSGLVTELGPGWSIEQLRPVVESVRSAFGSTRLMWGSDWPVLLPESGYGDWLDATRELVPVAWHDLVLGGNAARIYKLDQGQSAGL